MKSTNILILACIVAILIFLPLRIALSNYEQSQDIKETYTNITYNSVEDAGSVLLSPTQQISIDEISEGYSTSTDQVSPNLDLALNRFYKTLYLNLGISNDKTMQDAYKLFVPLKLVVAYDGYYINAWSNVKNISTGKLDIQEQWQSKKAYSYTDSKNNLLINFTLDDYVKVYELLTGKWNEGKRIDMQIKYPTCSILTNQHFDSFRRQIIISLIIKDLQFYSTRNSNLAQRYGFKYNFNLSYLQNDDSFSTISNTCFIAFFQGLPIDGYYHELNTFAVGASKIIRKPKYYGNLVNGILTYHEEGCPNLTNSNKIFYSPIEAAKAGYHPCTVCKP